ncbi:hypothetical protein HNR42_002356 [Deinobacterium chartae]|uniref:Uncharacterized protein n=1 Tax=Deinobacterium chartae TaxID=521158 RepID=A0A841HZG4_9DEIO|nr:hypothetical protein [Deinobacterium chartae]MBB6098921.1 hypothetical protein [Deinobacterium chartae]
MDDTPRTQQEREEQERLEANRHLNGDEEGTPEHAVADLAFRGLHRDEAEPRPREEGPGDEDLDRHSQESREEQGGSEARTGRH